MRASSVSRVRAVRRRCDRAVRPGRARDVERRRHCAIRLLRRAAATGRRRMARDVRRALGASNWGTMDTLVAFHMVHTYVWANSIQWHGHNGYIGGVSHGPSSSMGKQYKRASWHGRYHENGRMRCASVALRDARTHGDDDAHAHRRVRRRHRTGVRPILRHRRRRLRHGHPRHARVPPNAPRLASAVDDRGRPAASARAEREPVRGVRHHRRQRQRRGRHRCVRTGDGWGESRAMLRARWRGFRLCDLRRGRARGAVMRRWRRHRALRRGAEDGDAGEDSCARAGEVEGGRSRAMRHRESRVTRRRTRRRVTFWVSFVINEIRHGFYSCFYS